MFLIFALILSSGLATHANLQNFLSNEELSAPVHGNNDSNHPAGNHTHHHNDTEKSHSLNPEGAKTEESKHHSDNTHQEPAVHVASSTLTASANKNHESAPKLDECAVEYISQVMGRLQFHTDTNSKKTKEEHIKHYKEEIKNTKHCPAATRDTCGKISDHTQKLKQQYLKSIESSTKGGVKEDDEKELDHKFVKTLEKMVEPIFTCKSDSFSIYHRVAANKFLHKVRRLLREEKDNKNKKALKFRIKEALTTHPTEDETDLVDIALAMFDIAEDFHSQKDNKTLNPTFAARKTKRMILRYDERYSEKEPHTKEDEEEVNKETA